MLNKLITKTYKYKNLKWVLSRKTEIEYSFLRLKISFDLVIGIGYFTAYEDEIILVKIFMVPFFRITTTYNKKIIIKS